MRTPAGLTAILLAALLLTSCFAPKESGADMESRYVETISAVEGVTEVDAQWHKGGGVASDLIKVRIYTDTNDLSEREAIQYRAWEAIVPTINEDSRVSLQWVVVNADRNRVTDLDILGFNLAGNESQYKRQWEVDGVRDRYDGPK